MSLRSCRDEQNPKERENGWSASQAKLEIDSRASVKMLVELPIDVADVTLVAVTKLHVALILLLVDPIDDVPMAIP